jgi:hypothetical protein
MEGGREEGEGKEKERKGYWISVFPLRACSYITQLLPNRQYLLEVSPHPKVSQTGDQMGSGGHLSSKLYREDCNLRPDQEKSS